MVLCDVSPYELLGAANVLFSTKTYASFLVYQFRKSNFKKKFLRDAILHHTTRAANWSNKQKDLGMSAAESEDTGKADGGMAGNTGVQASNTHMLPSLAAVLDAKRKEATKAAKRHERLIHKQCSAAKTYNETVVVTKPCRVVYIPAVTFVDEVHDRMCTCTATPIM